MQRVVIWANTRVGMLLMILGIALAAFFLVRVHAQERTATAAPQVLQTVVLDNTHVHIRHVTFGSGYHQPMHSVGAAGDGRYDLMILLTPAQLEGRIDDKKMVSDKPGTIWEIHGAPSQHAFANLSNQPIDALIVEIK